jgi:CubicO group peptidase (beta-lactamase class C family)
MRTKLVFSILLTVSLILALSACGGGEGAVSVTETATAPVTSATEAATGRATEAPTEPTTAAPTEPEYDNDWLFEAPEKHGVNPEILEQLHQVAAGVTEIKSIVTVKDGVVVDEFYNEGYNQDSVFRLASCSKSFTGALIGLAIEQGLIEGVEQPAADFLPGLADSDDPLKQEITVWDLLTHSSGLEWYEWNGGNSFGLLRREPNWVDYITSRPMAYAPGAVFSYSTGGSHLLAAILQDATGRTAADFCQEYLFDPLGMDSAVWREDDQGVTDGGNGVSMTALDAAKFGQLYLDGGNWRGRQIIPADWAEASTYVQFPRSGNGGSYGYQWWIRSFGGYESYHAMGHGGNFIFVVPDLNLVTVMTCSYNDTYAPWQYFEDYVIPAAEETV